MNLLITHVFSTKNKGDAAILSAMKESFRIADSKVRLRIVTSETQKVINEQVYYSFFYLSFYKPGNLIWKIVRSSYVIAVSLIWSFIKVKINVDLGFLLKNELRRTLNAHYRADAIVPVGGGYLTGKNNFHGNMTIIFQIHALVVPIILQKPIFLYSQSVGPFGNNFQKRITKWALSKVNKIYIREDISLKTLKELGVPEKLSIRSSDAAFTFHTNKKINMYNLLLTRGVDFQKMVVGITLKKFLDGAAHKTYVKNMGKFISGLQQTQNFCIILIPQVTSVEHNDDDRKVMQEVYEYLSVKRDIFFFSDEFEGEELKGIYENLFILIGTRMHSCIFSLTGSVPVIAIQYEYKTKGVMRDLGLEEWVIPIDKVEEKILNLKFNLLLGEARKIYIEHLKSVLPEYKKQARKPALEIVEYLNQSS